VWLHLFLILAGGGSCGKLRAVAALLLGEEIPAPVVQQAGWVREPVSTSRRTGFTVAGNGTTTHRLSILQHSQFAHYVLEQIQAVR